MYKFHILINTFTAQFQGCTCLNGINSDYLHIS